MPDSYSWVTWLSIAGAFCFGIVIGWVSYRTLRRSTTSGLSDISTVIGIVGGAAVVALFPRATGEFGAYAVGLLIGFLSYVKVAASPVYKDVDWLGSAPNRSNSADRLNEPGSDR
jgi:Kef-type K+ transport system membrane component KefB